MQFFWVYIDDMLGKGISVWVILELIFYVSAGVVPLALPLAVLLSSVMTLGNLAEKNELTALKSAGLSLFKILKPLTIVIVFISLGAFYFSNYIIPVANLNWHSIIYDIQNTKISAIVKPGAYSDELEGYSIKVGKEKDASFEDILIHDHSSPKELKTVRAQKGKMYKSVNGKYLFLDLLNGDMVVGKGSLFYKYDSYNPVVILICLFLSIALIVSVGIFSHFQIKRRMETHEVDSVI